MMSLGCCRSAHEMKKQCPDRDHHDAEASDDAVRKRRQLAHCTPPRAWIQGGQKPFENHHQGECQQQVFKHAGFGRLMPLLAAFHVAEEIRVAVEQEHVAVNAEAVAIGFQAANE